MRRAPVDDLPRAARAPGRPPARPDARGPRLRLTTRGVVVLGVLAAVLITLVVLLGALVVRLVSPEPQAAAPVLLAPAPVCEPEVSQSQNCWPAFTDGADPQLEQSPWVTGRLLGGDVRTVLDHVAARFDAEVEPVDRDSSWGWGYRTVRGDSDLSNHASGTSIDLNATEHPLGATDTFTDDQVAALREILAEVAPVVAWGGDFSRADEMHFEIVGDAAAVAEVAARLRGEPAPPPLTRPAPARRTPVESGGHARDTPLSARVCPLSTDEGGCGGQASLRSVSSQESVRAFALSRALAASSRVGYGPIRCDQVDCLPCSTWCVSVL